MRSCRQLFSMACLVSLPAMVAVGADPILTKYQVADAAGAYALYTIIGAGHGNNVFYQPLRPEIDTATFLGFVAYPQVANQSWNHYDSNYYLEDTIRVYRTQIVADQDMVIPMFSTGDDGYAVYLDGVYTAGIMGTGPPPESWSIPLLANVPVFFEAAIYNGPGPTQLTLLRSDTFLPLESTPGVRIQAVPEPSTSSLGLIGAIALGWGWIRSRRRS